jgi:integrase
LSARAVASVLAGSDKEPKRYYGDGGGLWLVVTKRDADGKPVAASWVFRFLLYGKSREMGLGSAWDVKLVDAREAARLARVRVRVGKTDVLEERRVAETERRQRTQLEAARRMTFEQSAERLIAAKESGWRNAKHRRQWPATLATYVYPIIGHLPVAEIDTGMIVKVIEPIWLSKTETASRLRGRIESVLDWAKVAGFRTGENPARWKGHLEHLLPQKSKVAPIEHHAALPYRDIGTFVAELRQHSGVAARALEFAILCWSRTGEVISAKWDEIDIPQRVWVIPAERMKANKEHRVPLSGRAMQIIGEMQRLRERRPSEYVFQGLKDGQPLSNMSMLMLLRRMGHEELTAHGFRSTARDWASERIAFPTEMCEMALSHTVSDKVEAAYRRGTMFEKRRVMADAWARYIDAPAAENGNGKVVAIGAA